MTFLETVLALPEAPGVTLLVVRPDDVIVITFPGAISEESAQRIKRVAEEQAFPGHKVLVIGDGGVVSSVVRQDRE